MPKHKGSRCDYIDERDAFLYKVYRDIINSCNHIKLNDVMQQVISRPAPRYWCSEFQAMYAIMDRIHGRQPKSKPYPERKRLYDHLYERYLEERKRRPDDSLTRIAFDLVNSPAPESFLRPDSVKIFINRYHRKHVSSNMDRVRQLANRTNEIVLANAERSSHSADDARPKRPGSKHGNKPVVADVDKNIVHDDSCQLAAPIDQLIQLADSCVSRRGKDAAIRHLVYGSAEYTKHYNKRFTNHRYQRAQLRIDWDDCHEV